MSNLIADYKNRPRYIDIVKGDKVQIVSSNKTSENERLNKGTHQLKKNKLYIVKKKDICDFQCVDCNHSGIYIDITDKNNAIYTMCGLNLADEKGNEYI